MLRDDLVFSSLWLQNALIFSLVWGLGSILTRKIITNIETSQKQSKYFCHR